MSDLLKNIGRLILFILVQVFVLNPIPPVHAFVVPYIYYLFILWLPFGTNRFLLMIAGFICGISLDYFMKTPGLHAAPCVLIAYFRPFLINILVPQQGAEMNYKEPSIKSLGLAPYLTYVLVLTLMHHFCLFLLEALQFGGIVYFIGKLLVSTAISMVLIIILELFFPRKQKFITNT
jgi:hypothetical protein